MCIFAWVPRSDTTVVGYPLAEEEAKFEEEAVSVSIANLRMLTRQKSHIWKDLQRTIRIKNSNHRAIRGLSVMVFYDTVAVAQSTRWRVSSEPLMEGLTIILLALLILIAAMFVAQLYIKCKWRAIESRQRERPRPAYTPESTPYDAVLVTSKGECYHIDVCHAQKRETL